MIYLQVVEDVKSGTKSTMQSTVRIILKTLPGRLALRSLEASLQVSEVLLNMLDTDVSFEIIYPRVYWFTIK